MLLFHQVHCKFLDDEDDDGDDGDDAEDAAETWCDKSTCLTQQ